MCTCKEPCSIDRMVEEPNNITPIKEECRIYLIQSIEDQYPLTIQEDQRYAGYRSWWAKLDHRVNRCVNQLQNTLYVYKDESLAELKAKLYKSLNKDFFSLQTVELFYGAHDIDQEDEISWSSQLHFRSKARHGDLYALCGDVSLPYIGADEVRVLIKNLEELKVYIAFADFIQHLEGLDFPTLEG